MASGWRKPGSNALLSTGGKGYWCEACPCIIDCYTAVIAAIRERQAALKRTVWSAVPDPEKTLEQCITEVNAMAPSFVSGDYSGGASLPTMRSSSYATGAADFCELLDLIRPLVTTKHSITIPADSGGRMYFYQKTTCTTLAAAMEWALDNAYSWGRTGYADSWWGVSVGGDGYYTIQVQWQWGPLAVTSLYAGPARTVALFVKSAVPSGSGTKVYDKQGAEVTDSPGDYFAAGTGSIAAGGTACEVDSIGLETSPPNATDTTYEGGKVVTGYGIYDGFFLVTWSFTYR